MIAVINSILVNVLTGLYQPFWFAVILSVLFMFSWKNYTGIKEALRQWIHWFKTEALFRRMFLLTFYTVMILFRTLLNRSMWLNPLSNVIGIWGLYKLNNAGELVLTTEVPENLALFIPFTILLLWTHRERILGEPVRLTRVLWQSTRIVFWFSFAIETLQLILRLGTWQLSDLFFNSLGGFIGGWIYWVGYRLKHGKDSGT